MNYINDVLKDESKNDKQLIKELSIYVRNHDSKKLPINKKFVKDIIDIILKNSEIDCNSVYFFSGDRIAYWNVESKILAFNMTKVLNISINTRKNYYNTNIGNIRIFIYNYVISTIIHELTHARQYYLIETERNKIYYSCDRYNENHDKVLYERYANLREWILAYQVLSYVYPSKYTDILKLLIIDYLLDGYYVKEEKMISAIDTYNLIMEECQMPKVNIDVEEDIDFYSRLYLGLPISEEEYKKIMTLYDDIYEGKYDGKEQSHDIKKLINKL